MYPEDWNNNREGVKIETMKARHTQIGRGVRAESTKSLHVTAPWNSNAHTQVGAC